ncbi:4-alpha-glucanotransferase [Anaeromyxobacter sp. SG17]|uniref:4-alpha-glucanotransferase n=1 Tax=Anaeromyxobacter sp. SG17 TaxID=2925405 RepID=UPI001F57F49E|nr:4-alpha-glucanotransferase [Anaeromyxobacter sp. SG17]
MSPPARRLVREALEALGIRRLLLGVHDAAFPTLPGEDVGRGSPSADGAVELLELASALGFDGLQLGPSGATSASNPSPYDGTLFSRNPLSIALAPLTRPEWACLLREETLAELVAARPGGDRVAYGYAFAAMRRALAEVAARFRAARAAGAGGPVAELAARLTAFRAEHAGWLVPDALYEVLEREHGGASWRAWPSREDRELFAPGPGAGAAGASRREALLARHRGEVEDHSLVQLLAHEQHAAFRARARALGLALHADLQAGMSERDVWAAQGLVLDGWRMGAPPSRTDPEGQPWGFAVLDPRGYFETDASGGRADGPVIRFLRARVRKVLAEHDGLRVDHPHGLVAPWVYRAGGEPGAAVRAGARLFCSPELPELAALAIARADQVNPGVPRHADDRVVSLDDDQVARYGALFDVIMEAVPEPRDVACEILSTQPYPLARVIARHGLGRFRVTQKANLDDPRDVYRGENAKPEDWIMLGNHDTPTVWTKAERWVETGASGRHAEHLASRLLAENEDRAAWARAVAADPAALAQARFAELFVGPARHVMVHFTDLLGSRAPYNVPGTVSGANWSLRIPHDVRTEHAARVRANRALDLPGALARALRARGAGFVALHRELLAGLDAAARPAR